MTAVTAERPGALGERRRQALQQRRRDSAQFPAPKGRIVYDTADYAEEWEFLTAWGMDSNEIIARSRPTRRWFAENIRHLVSVSVCGTCRRTFDPRAGASLTRCTPVCGYGPSQ